jgi:hypothetical protein
LTALRDSEEPSVGTRMFLNMINLLVTRFDATRARGFNLRRSWSNRLI